MVDSSKRRLPAISPEKFWSHAGEEPPLPWPQWEESFRNYILLLNEGVPVPDQTSETVKNVLLQQLMGNAGIKAFSAHVNYDKKDSMSNEDYLKAARSVFHKPVSQVRAHVEFSKRLQGSTEPVSEYLLSLRTLLAECEFPVNSADPTVVSVHELREFLLAVQLARGTYNKDAQQKILQEHDVSLERYIDIAQADETSRQDTSRLNVVDGKVAKTMKSFDNRKIQRDSKAESTNSCKGCGHFGHSHGHKNCPAKGKKCTYCNNFNHFAKCCLKKQFQTRKPKPQNFQTKSLRKRHHQNHGVHGISGSPQHRFETTVLLSIDSSAQMHVTAEVDSCSDITAITWHQFQTHFQGQCQLNNYNQKLTNFDGTAIQGIKGWFTATVTFENRSAKIDIFVLPNRFGAIFGRDLINALGVILDGGSGAVRMLQSASQQPDISEMLGSAGLTNLTKKDIGKFPDYKHRIQLIPDAILPKPCKLRSIPLYRWDKTLEEIDSMVQQGIWHKVERSTVVNGMVTVDKPNGDVRITSDLSQLNKVVDPFRFPLPNIRDLYTKLCKATYFSKLDLRKGYFNIDLDESSSLLTTTITPKGLFAYDKLPMGLKDSAAVFQNLVYQTLVDLPGCESYIDDILVYGATREEHDVNLLKVLKRLDEKNLRLNLDKCMVATVSVPFLGHIISAGEIRPDPKNIASIQNIKEPTNVKEVRCLLGMLNYYQDFLPRFTKMSEPLRELTRQGVNFEWTRKHQNAFQKLKEMISCDLKLGIFDPQFTTILSTDASDVGIGGVLSQVQFGKEIPIAFGHHTLSPRERGWAVNEREAFAAMYFCEYFEKFLLGRPFTLRSDHQALAGLLRTATNKRQSSKFGRWIERLSEFNYTFEYRKGTENIVPDALSRLVNENEIELTQETKQKLHKIQSEQGFSIETFKDATLTDPTLKEVTRFVTTGWPKSAKQLSVELQPFFKLRSDLTMENGYIVRCSTNRILVPRELRQDLLKKAHEGHPGIVRFKRKLRELYWWPGIDAESERFVRQCLPCNDSAKSNPKGQVPKEHLYTPDKPWEEVSIDITGPFVDAPSHAKFIVVVIDNYSKFPEILCTTEITAKSITNWLSQLFSRYGNPAKIISDNGPQFKCDEFSRFLQERDILHEFTPVYTPQRNAFVETFNRFLKHGIQTFGSSHQPWREGLNQLLAQFRSTSPGPEEPCPAEKFLNRKPRLPFQIVRFRRTRERRENREDTSDQPTEVETTNQGLHRRSALYRVGQRVRVKRPFAPKGRSPWSQPLTVVNVLGNWTFELSDGNVWNARRMRHYIDEAPNIQHRDEKLVLPSSSLQQPRRSNRTNMGLPPRRFMLENTNPISLK